MLWASGTSADAQVRRKALVCRPRASGQLLAGLVQVHAGAVTLAGWIVAAISPALAQNLSIGGALGTNLTPNFQPFPMAPGPTFTNTKTLLGGGEAGWSFSGPISIEVDGLYRRMHTRGIPRSSFSVVTWEFPILAKYRFSLLHRRPLVEAGPSFRATGNLNDIHPSHYGFTAGAGVEGQTGRLRIEPAVRYTRWAQDRPLRSDIRTKTDQLELLVGFRAGSLSNARPLGARVSLGVAVGTNLTSDFSNVTSLEFPPALANTGYSYQTVNTTFVSSPGRRSLVGGPLVTVELARVLSVEVQAIYRPLRSSVKAFLADARKDLTLGDHRTTWEFPVLAQYRWRIGRTHPFVEMGPSFRLLQDVYGATPYGVTAGAGVEERVGSLKIRPGVRFTHWAQHAFPASTDPLRNEVAILTGFSL